MTSSGNAVLVVISGSDSAIILIPYVTDTSSLSMGIDVTVTENNANNNNNGLLTVAHAYYRDATASDVVTDQTNKHNNQP